MNEEAYCLNCDNKLTYIASSLLFSECYYCESCDIFYHKRLVKISEESFKGFSTARRGELVELARIIKAKSKITKKDLVYLGYL